jgi:hypothetical protein
MKALITGVNAHECEGDELGFNRGGDYTCYWKDI